MSSRRKAVYLRLDEHYIVISSFDTNW